MNTLLLQLHATDLGRRAHLPRRIPRSSPWLQPPWLAKQSCEPHRRHHVVRTPGQWKWRQPSAILRHVGQGHPLTASSQRASTPASVPFWVRIQWACGRSTVAHDRDEQHPEQPLGARVPVLGWRGLVPCTVHRNPPSRQAPGAAVLIVPRAIRAQRRPPLGDSSTTSLRSPNSESESSLDCPATGERGDTALADQPRRQPAIACRLSNNFAVRWGTGEHTRTPGREPVVDRCAGEQQRCWAHQLD